MTAVGLVPVASSRRYVRDLSTTLVTPRIAHGATCAIGSPRDVPTTGPRVLIMRSCLSKVTPGTRGSYSGFPPEHTGVIWYDALAELPLTGPAEGNDTREGK